MAYQSQFSVDMYDYYYYDYFYEDVLPFSWLNRLVRKNALKKQKQQFTIEDLVKFAQSKKWGEYPR